jgi:hypothetical protein
MSDNRTKTIRMIAAFAMVVLAIAAFNIPASAQKAGLAADFTIGKKGEVHFNIPVKAGGAVLQPGMYQVQHLVEGGDHIVIFKEMEMPAGYRHSNIPVSKEAAARVKCNIEPVDTKVSNTKITLRTNAAGEKEIAEVQVAGEAFKHLF